MPRPRVMLANEFGAGRGHLVTLRQLACVLGQGFDFDAALCRRQFETLLTEVGVTTFDGPGLQYTATRRSGPDAVPTATWGEFLGDLGFDHEDRIEAVLDWWLYVLQSRTIALLIADYAPLGLLAARCLGIPTIATGTGYGLPPWHMAAFPLHDPGQTQRLYDEADILGNLNRVLQRKGGPRLASFPEVYRADCTLVRTLPFLDPYRHQRHDPYLPPVADIAPNSALLGDEVFVYFSTSEVNDPEIVAAVAGLKLPRRGYLPAAPPGVAQMLAASGMIIEPAQVPVAEIARKSRMMLNSGQHGILSLGLYAGLPQVCLPQHNEQDWHARATETQGVARVAARGHRGATEVRALIETVYHDQTMFDRATDLARDLRAALSDTPDAIAARAIAPLIAQMRA